MSTTEPGRTAAQPGTAPLVLVVDDEAPVANVLREFFEGRGARVTVAADGQAGLEAFLAETPDLVVCDLLLPKRNGFELVEDFAQLDATVPVVVVTGVYVSDAYRDKLPHARAFLGKPIDLAKLGEIATQVAGKARVRETPRAAAGDDASAPEPARTTAAEPWVPTALVPLPRMLSLLHRERVTGLLTHRVGERRTVFTLQDGQLRFVRCNDPDMRLDRVLAQLGLVSEDDAARVRASLEARTKPTRFGEVVVEMGLLAAEEVRGAVQVQLRRMIAQAFNEHRGETLFRAETSVAAEDIRIDTDLRAVIVAGCAAWNDDEHVLGFLPDSRCLVVAEEHDEGELKLPATVRQLLDATREPTPLGRVVSMAELVGLRGRPLVFGLLAAGALRLVSDPAWDAASGTLRDLGVPEGVAPPDVFLRLEERGTSGLLRVRTDGTSSWIRFRDGRVVGAGSDDVGARLGRRLVAAGIVSEDELEEALSAQRAVPGAPLGRILVEQGRLEPAQLGHALTAQVLGIARDALSVPDWDEAELQEGGDGQEVALACSASDLVLDALRGMRPDRLRLLARALAADRPTIACDRITGGRFTLTDTEEMVTLALTSDTEQLLSAVLEHDCDPEVLRMAVLGLLVSPAGSMAEEPVEA